MEETKMVKLKLSRPLWSSTGMIFKTLKQIFADVPKEFYTRKITAHAFSRSGKPLGEVEAAVCRNGIAYCRIGELYYIGHVIEGDFWGNSGA
jgi:hypothetical protein